MTENSGDNSEVGRFIEEYPRPSALAMANFEKPCS